MRQRAFTVVELMVVIGIIAVLGGIGVTNFVGFRRAQDLKSAGVSLVNYLRDTQQKAITQEIGPALSVPAKWGIRLEAPSNGDDSYAVFYCNDCSAVTTVSRVALPSSIEFSVPAQGDPPKDIIFSKRYGVPEGGSQTIVVTQIGGGSSKTINITSSGLIEAIGF